MKRIWFLVCLLTLANQVLGNEKNWKGDSELSFIKTTGNSVTDSLLAKQTLIYDMRPWRNTLKMEASNVSSEIIDPATLNRTVVRTGERYYLTEQLDRFVSEFSYAFFRGTYEKDRFSGFDNQTTMVLGYGRTLIKMESLEMKGEIGFGRSGQEWDECDAFPCDPNTPYGQTEVSPLRYVSEALIWKISTVAEVGQDISIEDTDENRVSRFHAYIRSQLVGNLAMKFGFSLKHTDEVPDDKRHKDEELTASLVYSF